MPWCDSATARTIERPRPDEPLRSPAPRKKRSKTLSRSSGGMPGPVVLDREHDLAVAALDRRLDRGARVGVAERVLHQVQHEPVQLVARAVDLGARRAPTIEISWSPATGSSSAAASVTTSDEVDRLRAARRGRRRRARAAAGRRPGGACGARSAARRRRPRAARPSSSSSSSSRLASTEVSGVRSSCEASATNSRWRASVASVSARASSSACEHRLQRARQLGDLVVGLGVRDPHATGRACARSRARRGQLGDRLHRAARGRQAGEQRQRGAAEHAEGRGTRFTRLAVAWTSESSRAYWSDHASAVADDRHRRAVSTRQPSISPRAARAAARSRARRAVLQPTQVVRRRDDADGGVLAARRSRRGRARRGSSARAGCRRGRARARSRASLASWSARVGHLAVEVRRGSAAW